MPPWQLAARAEEVGSGHTKYTNTGVEYGDDGIKGLRNYVPLAQSEWLHDGTAGHTKSDEYDATTSRILTRITSGSAGTITSRMRKAVLVPRDFWKFPPSGFEFFVRGSATLPSAVTMTVKRLGTADDTVNDFSILPAVPSVFEAKQLDITATTYLAGDLIILEFKVTTGAGGRWAEIGGIGLGYITSRGNV